MKLQLVLLTMGLLTACLQSGLGAATVRVRAYTVTGAVDNAFNHNAKVAITLGTRLLLTCDVTGFSEGNKVVSYRWLHSNTVDTRGSQRKKEIQDRDPYYRTLSDTLLVDVTSLDQGGRYSCSVTLRNGAKSTGITALLTVASNPAPFLYTPTSLLPEHSVITDVQQATGKNGQQWITCRSKGEGTRPKIWMGSEEVVLSHSTANSAIFGLGSQHPNGLYHCLSAQSQREYFSLYLRNSVTLPTPNVSGRHTTMWTLTSTHGIQVKRYIVEFECRVRNMTYIRKYMSVNASGGTGRVATSVSCFGGLGQLYRVKVWAVSGPSISPVVDCTPDGQCSEEGRTESTTEVTNNYTTTTPTNSPSSSKNKDDTFIPVGVGVGMLLLLVISIVVVILVVLVAVKRRAAHNQKRKRKIRDGCGKSDDDKKAVYTQKEDAKKPHRNTSLREMEGRRSNGCEYEDVDMDEEMGSIIDDFSPHEDVDSEAKIKHVNIQGLQGSSTPASATKTPPVYTVVDQCKKMGAQWKEDNGYTVAFIHQCTIPMMDEMSDSWKGVVASGGVETREQYEDTVEISERTPRVHPRCAGVELREQYEDTVNIRYEALENQRHTWNLGSEC